MFFLRKNSFCTPAPLLSPVSFLHGVFMFSNRVLPGEYHVHLRSSPSFPADPCLSALCLLAAPSSVRRPRISQPTVAFCHFSDPSLMRYNFLCGRAVQQPSRGCLEAFPSNSFLRISLSGSPAIPRQPNVCVLSLHCENQRFTCLFTPSLSVGRKSLIFVPSVFCRFVNVENASGVCWLILISLFRSAF